MYRIYFCAILSINYVKHSLEVEKVFVSPSFLISVLTFLISPISIERNLDSHQRSRYNHQGEFGYPSKGSRKTIEGMP